MTIKLRPRTVMANYPAKQTSCPNYEANDFHSIVSIAWTAVDLITLFRLDYICVSQDKIRGSFVHLTPVGTCNE